MKRPSKPVARTAYRVTVGDENFHEGDTVYLIDDDGTDCPWFSRRKTAVRYKDGDYSAFYWQHLEPINDIKENDMSDMNVANAIRDEKLTANQRLLREQGLVDDCGTVTSSGQQAIFQILIKEHEDTLVAAINRELKNQDVKKK